MEIINSQKERGRVYINKLSAAERQLEAAIRMYFMEEDSIAVHVVASAAYNLYADMLRHRGKEEAVWPIVYGILRAAKDHAEGLISKEEIESWADGAFSAIEPYVHWFKQDPSLKIEDVNVDALPADVTHYWKKTRVVVNFLKHADRDALGILDEAAINNDDLIMKAINCSLHLNCDLNKTKEFFLMSMYGFGHLKCDRNTAAPLMALIGFEKSEIMILGRKNLCYARIDDEVEIDFESAKERSRKIVSDLYSQG